jgi:hypothetical protein
MKRQSAINWAAEQFGGADLGDGRWNNRLVCMAGQAARKPGGKVAEVYCNDAERQGAYGLLECEEILPEKVAVPMFQATARSCAQYEFIFCAVDGSSIALVDKSGKKNFGSVGSHASKGRGLKVINALAISPSGLPLGLLSQQWWARPKTRSKKHRDKRKTEEKETQHWVDAMAQAREMMAEFAPKTRCWFQSDRETDAWPILKDADKEGHWFTVRGNHNRRVKLASGVKTCLRTLAGQQPEICQYVLPVTPGPNRTGRQALMVVRAFSATLDFRDKRTGKRFEKTVNVVLAQEKGITPPNEKPIEWLLLTNRPIETQEQLQQVLLGYAQRWKIEEFHRSWKSGACRVEEMQLHTMDSAIKWATILAAVAVRIERIKLLSRREPERPATDEFSELELRAIILLHFEASAKKRLSSGKIPTLGEATYWLAKIGGYTGKSSGGPPGSVTLARGLKEVQSAVRALKALQAESYD